MVVMRTVDTDVVVLAAAFLSNINLEEMWIVLGTGSSFQYISAHQLVAAVNPRQCTTLSIFHSLTVCDTVSFIVDGGKKIIW